MIILKLFWYIGLFETECSKLVRNFSLPLKDNPTKIIILPVTKSKIPLVILSKVTTPPTKPKIKPRIIYVVVILLKHTR